MEPPSTNPSDQRSLSEQLLGSDWIDSAELFLPEAGFGRYRVLRRLGEGGTSEVLLAEDPGIGRLVAIKALRPRPGLSKERFQREVRVLAELRHPNIVQIFDVGVASDGRPFYVMESGGGCTLANADLGLEQFVAVLESVASACACAHERGVVHRDLKPSNILVGERTLVVDFGVAKLLHDASVSSAGSLVGTPAFMAPEQVTGGALGPWTDVYALGLMLYERLAGRPARRSSNLTNLLREIKQGQLEKPSAFAEGVPAGLEELCLAALQREPRARPDAKEFATALGAWRRGEVRSPSSQAWAAAFGGVVALLALVAAWGGASWRPAPSPSPVSQAAPAPGDSLDPVAPTRSPRPTEVDRAEELARLGQVWRLWTEVFVDRQTGVPPNPGSLAQASREARACALPLGRVLEALLDDERAVAAQRAEELADPSEVEAALLGVARGQLALLAGQRSAAAAAFERGLAVPEAAGAARVGRLLLATFEAEANPGPPSATALLERGVEALQGGVDPAVCKAFAVAWRSYGRITGLMFRTRGVPPPQRRSLTAARDLLSSTDEGEPSLLLARGSAALILWFRLDQGGEPQGLADLEEAARAAPRAAQPRLSLALAHLLSAVRRRGRDELEMAEQALDRAERLAPQARDLPHLRRALERRR